MHLALEKTVLGHKKYDVRLLSSGQFQLNAETIKEVTIATLRMLRTTVTAANLLVWSYARHWDVGQEPCRWNQPLSLKGSLIEARCPAPGTGSHSVSQPNEVVRGSLEAMPSRVCSG